MTTRFPLDYLTGEQLIEARRLVELIVKATRHEINHLVRETEDGNDLAATINYRAQLNDANRRAKALYQTADSLSAAWSHIVEVARATASAPEQANRLDTLRGELLQHRDATVGAQA